MGIVSFDTFCGKLKDLFVHSTVYEQGDPCDLDTESGEGAL